MVALSTMLLYARKLDNPFVWDDYRFVLRAPEHDRIENIPGFFTTDQHRLYRPLRSVAYTLVRSIAGLNPAAHHALGLFFHLTVALLFCVLVLQLSGNIRLAFLAGMIAGLHPVLCDRAVSVTGSFDLMGMMFGYGALVAFLQWLKTGRRTALLGMITLLVLGLLGSEETATVPLLMVLFYLALPSRPEGSRRFGMAAAIAFSLLIVYLVLRTHMVPGFARVEHSTAGGPLETLLTMSVVFWRYIGLALFPVNLAPAHSVTIYRSLSLVPLAALAGLVALAVAAFAARKSRPMFFVAIGWIFIGLIPFANILPIKTLMAERYFYAGLRGFALAASLALLFVMDRGSGLRRLAATAAVGTLFGMFFFLSADRIAVWESDRTLWADALKSDPNTYLANLNWAGVLRQRGDWEGDFDYLKRAAAIAPDEPEAQVGLGNYHMHRNDPQKASYHYRMALDLHPGHVPGAEGLMQAELRLGHSNEAYRLALEMLERDPNNLVCLHVVGYILAGSGHCDRAVPVLRRLLEQKPDETIRASAAQSLQACEQKHAMEKE